MSSIKIRTKRLDGKTQIRTLITHPMANGRHKDKQGQLIPAHFIEELWVSHNDKKIIISHLSRSISKNPYFDFLLIGGKAGDKISISWRDNTGNTDSEDHFIK